VGDGSDRLMAGHNMPNISMAAYPWLDSLPRISARTVLLPNMVITIEPGM
jgi:Xaa-Pro aminopeptidase